MTYETEVHPYIAVVVDFSITLLEVISIGIFGYLSLAYSWFSKQYAITISPMMLCYILVQTLLCFFTLLQSAFLVIFWRPGEAIYNAYVLYFLGTFQIVIVVLASISVIFLGIDRCLCLQYPFKYTGFKRYLPVFLTVSLFFMAVLGALAKGAFPSLPASQQTSCRTYGCLASNMGGSFYVLLRCLLSGGNVITGAILAKLIWKKISNFRIVSNRIVFKTVFLALLLDFIPHLISFLCYTQFQINLNNYFGPYSVLLIAIDSIFCAFIYRRNLSVKKPITIIKSSGINLNHS